MENKLGNFLKQKREKSKQSQSTVSDKLGYTTPQFVSNWERGISEPPIKILRKLAHMYAADAEELFKLTLEHALNKVRVKMHEDFYGKLKTKK